MTSTGPLPGRLPGALRDYLGSPVLAPLWVAVRERLERNGVNPTGAVQVNLDDEAATAVSGLGVPVAAGERRVRLDRLDEALRKSAARQGLVTVVEQLTGPLENRKDVRRTAAEASAADWVLLEDELAAAGLSGQRWVPTWLAGLRRAGLLTRAGAEAERVIRAAVSVLAAVLPPTLDRDPDASRPEHGGARRELAQLAVTHTGGSHGLDDGTLASTLVLRGIAAAHDLLAPASGAARRELWNLVGVSPDTVSGTVLVWALRPPGDGPWARMMRVRAELRLVTHVTLQEWTTVAAAEVWMRPGERMWVCENPQVLQAAAAARVRAPLLCLSGNPASVGLLVIQALVAAGVEVVYHGDFDSAGVAIAGRLFARGVRPWRMGAGDYMEAVASRTIGELVALSGLIPPTPWDPELADAMTRKGVGVHEELLLNLLVPDLDI